MITKLSIKNFKSIRELDIDCARVNLFIGEPNTGKSNILEAIGIMGWSANVDLPLKDFLRFEYMGNLFYDNLTNQPFQIACIDDANIMFPITVVFDSQKDDFAFYPRNRPGGGVVICRLNHLGTYEEDNSIIKTPIKEVAYIKFYKFQEQTKFPSKFPAWLLPPNGSNLVSLLIGNKKARETASNLFKDFGFKMMFREHVDTLEQAKLIDDDIYSYPYISISDTLKRMIFYNAAIDSNENSTLIFEEPEVHAFPAYIKQLGEKIAFDETNQYFIVTHNPYLFLSIVEKTPKDDVNVFATYMKDYQTKVKKASHEQISMLMDYDPFFNLGQIIEEDDNDSN